jgi:predicted short-subunit dehydrogenase-like oxidoreductase (DUF2520 family)
MRRLLNISFAGAGNVAEALCKKIYESGHRIDLIVSKTKNSGSLLAHQCNASWSNELTFPDSTNVIIVAVPDMQIEGVLNTMTFNQETLVVHTAGSMGPDVFPDRIKLRGVFYPLQTFSRNRNVSFSDLPFFIESQDVNSSAILKNLAESIGGKAFFADFDQRQKLHLAAVFVNNFANHMLTIGKEMASDAGFDFAILEPLIEETIAKALVIGPEISQTGPAVRNDQNTIKKHFELLSFSPELQQIYSEISSAIIMYYDNIDKSKKI